MRRDRKSDNPGRGGREPLRWQWQIAATVLAVGGVVLNNGQIRYCFPVWLISNGICLVAHARARLWWLAVRDVVFSGLAVVGWFQWG